MKSAQTFSMTSPNHVHMTRHHMESSYSNDLRLHYQHSLHFVVATLPVRAGCSKNELNLALPLPTLSSQHSHKNRVPIALTSHTVSISTISSSPQHLLLLFKDVSEKHCFVLRHLRAHCIRFNRRLPRGIRCKRHLRGK